MMFHVTIPQPAEMGRARDFLALSVGGIGRRRQKRRMQQYWAPTKAERQINPTFIFNSA
jgi:hypothetical protein